MEYIRRSAKITKCKYYTEYLNTTDYIVNNMLKETGFVIVGIIDSPQQAMEIQGIVKLSILGFHIQDINKEV